MVLFIQTLFLFFRLFVVSVLALSVDLWLLLIAVCL